MEIKLVLSDIDGVWTDGGMYYNGDGEFMKKFNTSDSAGVLFLRHMGIPFGILSGEKNDLLIRRAEKLRIDHVYTGVVDKLRTVHEISENLNIGLEEIAYIGDDLNDMKVLQAVGLSAVPSQAPGYVKEIATWTLDRRGGEGVFREFVERLILTYWGDSFFRDLILGLS
jgi:YrbI family 3-deoxy-D-manno-octulosonate 8-phosphate phosphatase